MNTIVLVSGGMDSSTLLWSLANGRRGDTVIGLSVNYGQRHRKELECAKRMCDSLDVPHKVLDLGPIKDFIVWGSLTGAMPVPEGHYADETMRATVVPNRNMILLAIAAGYALSLQFERVAYAAHAGDHAIYPDCRPVFADAMRTALSLCDYQRVTLYTPYIELLKSDICKIGSRMSVPYEDTWSCYKGGDFHCGKCGTCVERREAFALAGVIDPTIYKEV